MFNRKWEKDFKELKDLCERASRTLYGDSIISLQYADYRDQDKPYYSIVDGVIGLIGRVNTLEEKVEKQQALLNEVIDYVYRNKK